MPSLPRLAAAGLCLLGVSLLLGRAPARSGGVLPGDLFILPGFSAQLPACGMCHDPAPNANGRIQLTITTPGRSIDASATIGVTMQLSGGPTSGLAGFLMETNGGSFVAGTSTRTTTAGDAITHANKFASSFQFQWQAPATPGEVQWTAAGQRVNGNGGTDGDSFGFWGPDSDKPGVPYRLYVNAAHATAYGAGCAGSDGHEPILGAPQTPRIGQPFATDCVNAPPATAVVFGFGLSDQSFGPLPLPFDLTALGAPGCFLRADLLVLQPWPTSGTGSGGGSARGQWAFPNDPLLRGMAVYFQALVVDPAANALRLTTSNGLKAVLQ